MSGGTFTLYHGSRTAFSSFSKDVEPRFDTGQHLLGHYLTDSPGHVLNYARGKHGLVYVTEATCSSMKVVPPSRSGMCEIDRMQLDYNEDDFEAYRANLIDEGHDAVCFESLDGYSEFVFLDARQITITRRLSNTVFKRLLASGEIEEPAISGGLSMVSQPTA